MFVRSETYYELHAEYMILLAKYNRLQSDWNDLVMEINRKGGREFLVSAKLQPDSPFDQAELRTLIKLCHPDKHGGDAAALAVTRKLLEMRK